MNDRATEIDTLARLRQEFRVLDDMTYIDVAGRAPMADRVGEAMEDYLSVCRTRGANKDEWFGRVELLRERTASLFNAQAHEIAFMKNTSDGLNTIGAALELGPGDTVLVNPEFEHANNVYPWVHLQDKGVRVRMLPVGPQGVVRPQDVAAVIDETTKLVTLSAVSAWTGARPDLPGISAVVHDASAFFLVDAAQAAGIVNIDVCRDGIDALAAATQKGLLGMYGLGVLYCNESRFSQLRPPFLSVAGVEREGLHESDLGDFEKVRPLGSAARFEVGNHNFSGLLAFDAALSIIEEVDVVNIERHVLELARRLHNGLDARDIQPSIETPQSGIVSFSASNPAELAQRLEDNHIRVSLRRGRVRASFHVYNDSSDVERLLNLL